MKTSPVICFVAGRSGGHILPCLTQARHMAQTVSYRFLFFTTSTDLDKKILANFELPHQAVFLPLDNIPYRTWWRLPLFCWHFFVSIALSIFFLSRNRPKKIVSMGGYISIPVCLAAFVLRIPIELYELNAVPGKAVKRLAPFATTVFVCFKESISFLPQKKCVLAPYPVRFSVPQADDAAHARTALGFDKEKKIIAILGGSQGSLFLNNIIKEWVNSYIATKDIAIIHQTGAQDTTNLRVFYQEKNIQALVFDYTHQVEQMYQSADIILCRAGAGTLFEICFFGKKCITIPLETKTTDHQKTNAHALAAQYPELVTVVAQKEVEKNKQLFFEVLYKKIQGDTHVS